jgi:hypothetical protein
MSRERELLEKAVDELERLEYRARLGNGELITDIRAELQKPEPRLVGWIEKQNGVFMSGWDLNDIENGKHKMYAVRIDYEP